MSRAASTSPPGWTGTESVAINNLMEDTATAEISPSQIWQWLHHGRVSADDVRRLTDEEARTLRQDYAEARELLRADRDPTRVRRVPDADRGIARLA